MGNQSTFGPRKAMDDNDVSDIQFSFEKIQAEGRRELEAVAEEAAAEEPAAEEAAAEEAATEKAARIPYRGHKRKYGEPFIHCRQKDTCFVCGEGKDTVSLSYTSLHEVYIGHVAEETRKKFDNAATAEYWLDNIPRAPVCWVCSRS